jgi:hypothetical protein
MKHIGLHGCTLTLNAASLRLIDRSLTSENLNNCFSHVSNTIKLRKRDMEGVMHVVYGFRFFFRRCTRACNAPI